MMPRPVAAIWRAAASASSACSPGMNRCVARFTNELWSAKSLRVLLREAARRIERPTDMALILFVGLMNCNRGCRRGLKYQLLRSDPLQEVKNDRIQPF